MPPDASVHAPATAPATASSCPYCGSPAEPSFSSPDRNRRVTAESFDYHRCTSCGLVFLVRRPDDLGRYYPDEYHLLPSRAKIEEIAAGERWRLDFVLPWADGGRLIEIGPGWGVFAFLAREAGFEVTAVEMDSACCAFLRDVIGVEAIHSSDPTRVLAGIGAARVIALWHVIEHLERPFDLLRIAAERLQPGGILVVATPNPGALGFRVLGARWPHVDAPRHQYLIPPSVLTGAAASRGLERVRIDSDDPGTRGWNTFGWMHALRPGHVGRRPGRPVELTGAVVSRLVRPLESRPGRGAAYTAVFRKTA